MKKTQLLKDIFIKKDIPEKAEKKAQNDEVIRETLDLSSKTALVYDLGIFTEMAASLKNNENGFGTVKYFVPWIDAFPEPAKQDVGKDFKGLTRVQDFWKEVPTADVIVFFDTYCGDLADYLRSMGYPVWGGGTAEEMELDRWKMRTIQNKIGLPTQQSLKIKSVDDLELYFQGIKNKVSQDLGKEDGNAVSLMWKKIKDKYGDFSDKFYFGDLKRLEEEWLNGAKEKFVKCNLRGLVESFYAEDYETSLTRFNMLYDKMGHRANAKDIEFIVEEKKGEAEPGTDAIQINGEYLSPTLYGIEKKGSGMIERILPYEELPESALRINNEMGKVIKDNHLPSASFISFEFRLEKDGTPYLIDPSIRCCAPVGSAIFCELYLNLPEIIWRGAHGQKCTPKLFEAKYAAGVNFSSEWAEEHELEITVEKDVERWVKFRKAYAVGGQIYACAGFSSIVSVIGFGNTPEEAVNLVKERAKKVHGYMLNTSTQGLDTILNEEIPNLEKIQGKKF